MEGKKSNAPSFRWRVNWLWLKGILGEGRNTATKWTRQCLPLWGKKGIIAVLEMPIYGMPCTFNFCHIVSIGLLAAAASAAAQYNQKIGSQNADCWTHCTLTSLHQLYQSALGKPTLNSALVYFIVCFQWSWITACSASCIAVLDITIMPKKNYKCFTFSFP